MFFNTVIVVTDYTNTTQYLQQKCLSPSWRLCHWAAVRLPHSAALSSPDSLFGGKTSWHIQTLCPECPLRGAAMPPVCPGSTPLCTVPLGDHLLTSPSPCELSPSWCWLQRRNTREWRWSQSRPTLLTGRPAAVADLCPLPWASFSNKNYASDKNDNASVSPAKQ